MENFCCMECICIPWILDFGKICPDLVGIVISFKKLLIEFYCVTTLIDFVPFMLLKLIYRTICIMYSGFWSSSIKIVNYYYYSKWKNNSNIYHAVQLGGNDAGKSSTMELVFGCHFYLCSICYLLTLI